jgi:hypothetical protein
MATSLNTIVHGVWVSESGEYGVGSLIVLHDSKVTVRQLEFLAQMPESERFAFAADLANGSDLTGWEIQYAGG